MTLFYLLFIGCSRGPAEGTFVGNPEMTTALRSGVTQFARGGALDVRQGWLLPCDSSEAIDIGQPHFSFRGEVSTDYVQFPPGEYCGIELDVDEMIVQFDDGGAELTSLIANDFSLDITLSLLAEANRSYVLQLADDTWLDALGDLVEPGETLVDLDSPLGEAFTGGLSGDSGVVDVPPTDGPLEGRLDIEDHPLSPNDFPTVQDGCEASVNYDMSFPIPPAAMASMGVEGVGWCESNLDFSDDLAPLDAILLDYSDGSTFSVEYNGWGQGCEELHCGRVVDDGGNDLNRSCSVLAFCDGVGLATATGYAW